MPLLTACASSKTETITQVKYVYVIPELYFPKFPGPKDGVIIPLDADYKVVKADVDEQGNPIEVVYDIVPEWWLKLVLDYKLDVDVAETKYKIQNYIYINYNYIII